ncbi:hypothetical protein EBT25_05305, partial [bacterium]|nr:hypothetical protein [bacterium]
SSILSCKENDPLVGSLKRLLGNGIEMMMKERAAFVKGYGRNNSFSRLFVLYRSLSRSAKSGRFMHRFPVFSRKWKKSGVKW